MSGRRIVSRVTIQTGHRHLTPVSNQHGMGMASVLDLEPTDLATHRAVPPMGQVMGLEMDPIKATEQADTAKTDSGIIYQEEYYSIDKKIINAKEISRDDVDVSKKN